MQAGALKGTITSKTGVLVGEMSKPVGSMDSMEGVNAQAKEVTASTQDQTVLPDSGFNYLTQVKVKGIPVNRTQNAAGGYTVTIG